jgi:hypothetical protein
MLAGLVRGQLGRLADAWDFLSEKAFYEKEGVPSTNKE